MLSAKTGGRVGHGAIGEVAEGLVKRGVRAAGEGVSKAIADFHRATAKGLENVAERTREADGRAAKSFKDLERPIRTRAPHPGGASTLAPAGPSRAALSKSIHTGSLDSLGRPTGVEAQLTKEHVLTGTPAAHRITPPGFEGKPAGHARGHLLGAQLGGSGTDPKNLVTIHQTPANLPVMRGYERQVRVALDAGQRVEYSSTPVYVGNELVARGITMRASGSGGLDFWVTVLNHGR
jgi:hypothetical protein